MVAGGKKSDGKESKKLRSEPVRPDPTVDRFLVALQKTLSRVSRDSATVSPDQARALIVGNVRFEVDLRCALREDEKLELRESGGFPLHLGGSIASDVGIELLEETSDAEKPQTGPSKADTKAPEQRGTKG